jgi:hypothetical protein
MSDIQRWHISVTGPVVAESAGTWVTYADHVASVAEAEQKWGDLSRDNWQDGYEQGQRNERERIKSVLRAYMHTSVAERAAQIIDGSGPELIRDTVSLASSHDPLCPMWSKVVAGDRCDCDLIAKVRADALAAAVAAVEALEPESYATGDAPYRMRGAAIAAIKAVRP